SEFSCQDLHNYFPSSDDSAGDARAVKNSMMFICAQNHSDDITNQQITDEMDGDLRKAESADHAPEPFRQEIVQDDESNINDRNYGNSDIMAGTPFHGTHCAGIIGAVRNN